MVAAEAISIDPRICTIPLLLLGSCLGVLFAAVLSLSYVYGKTRVPFHILMALLGFLSILFTLGEMGVATCALAGDPETGRQIHRLQALTVLLFLPGIPFILEHLIVLSPIWRRVNRAIVVAGLLFTAFSLMVAFAAPSWFVSPDTALARSLNIRWVEARGETGALYSIRDAWFVMLLFYAVAVFILDLALHGRKRFHTTFLYGFFFTCLIGIFNYLEVYGGPWADFLPLRNVSFGVLGITAFNIIIMGSMLQQYISRLRDRERVHHLESLAVLAGGIAHDFNNLLTAMLGNLSLLKANLNGENADLVGDAEKAVARATRLTRQLLFFTKGEAPVLKRTSLRDLIEDSAKFVLSGSNVKVEFAYDDPLLDVRAEEGQISQVIQNLVINAVQAMPDGGSMRISARNDGGRVHSTFPARRGERFVRIRIEDDGPGIPHDLRDKIFEPFFTTRPSGSGLGLAVCFSVVRNHGGHIFVESPDGKGTAFDVYLPAALDAALPEVPEKPKKPTRKGRILVLDDDDAVRKVVSMMLRSLGFEVAVFITGEEAVEAFRKTVSAGEGFDCAVLDLTLPGGLSGEETLQRLREIDPHVCALACSGLGDTLDGAWCEKWGFQAVLSKPFTIRELEEALHELIAVHAP